MAYADYGFYTDFYKGTLTEDEFHQMESRADAYLDYLTGNRLKQNPEAITKEVKMAVCAVLEELNRQEYIGKEGRISSFTNDGYTEHLSYGNDNRSNPRRLKETAMMYLSGTGLLYRGVSICG